MNNRLNPQQQKAALFHSGICAVIACPGSGKTLTMTERIAWLVKHHRVSPESILGLTFTRNAAQAMKNRLLTTLDEMASQVTLSTIHSFSLRLLRTEGRMFELLTGKDLLIVMRKIMQHLKIKDFPTGAVLRDISLAKNNLICVEDFKILYQGDELMTKVAAVYEAYEEEKKKELLLDLDDLLFETCKLLTDDVEVREKYQNTYRHLLVDEMQDTNPAQMEILKLLTQGIGDDGSNRSFWVCGDDFQAIFSFNGSSVGNILNFNRIFPGSAQIVLDTNYRSTPQILAACQNLIKYNTRKIEKQLITQNENGDDIVIIEAASEKDEAQQIVNEVLDLVNRRNFAWSDVAILYRANFQSRVIEDALAEHEIPYYIESGISFYKRHEIKILLDYMRLISSPDSEEGDDALKSVANIPNRYLGRSFLAEIETHAVEKGVHFYQGLKSMRIKVPYLKKNVKDFIKFLDPLMKKAKKLKPGELIHLLRDALDYDRYICEDDIPSPDDHKIMNLDQLESAASEFDSLVSFLEYTDSFQEDVGNDKEGVSLMTVHKSKGLEFPVVFVTGMIEGLLPHKNGDIEEERRICFVALSRAMKLLYLCHSTTYLEKSVKPSIFLSEINSQD